MMTSSGDKEEKLIAGATFSSPSSVSFKGSEFPGTEGDGECLNLSLCLSCCDIEGVPEDPIWKLSEWVRSGMKNKSSLPHIILIAGKRRGRYGWWCGLTSY